MSDLPADPAEILRGLIAAQSLCMAEARAGRGTGRSAYWARNHPRITKILPQAEGLLQPAERQDLYAALLRMGNFPDVRAGDLPLLIAAYRDILPDFALGQGMAARRLAMLHIFGFDENGAVDAPPADLAQLKARRKPVDHALKFSNLPGQRAKSPSFAALADQAPRILAVLRHAGYRHDHRPGADRHYAWADLLFWGFVLIVMLAPATRDSVVADMAEGGYDIPERARHEHVLHETLTSLGIDAGAHGAGIAQRCAARLAGSEAARWAGALNLSLPGLDWNVEIAIPASGNLGSGLIMPNLRLRIAPDPVCSWTIDAWADKKPVFSDHEGRGEAENRGIAALGAGNLMAFPQWLARLGTAHGHPHDPARAEVLCGRHRKAVAPIRAWLTGGVERQA